MHRENIKHIIEHGTSEQMHEMREVFEELVDYLKAYDHEMYMCVEYELHAIAHEQMRSAIPKCSRRSLILLKGKKLL